MSGIFSKKDGASGILYSEDFGEFYKNKVEKTETQPLVVEDKTEEDKSNNFISKDILDNYYNSGVTEGRRIEREAISNEKKDIEEDLKENILSVIKKIDKKIDKTTNEIHKEISFVVFKSLMNLFPNMLSQYGIEESKIILEKIIPNINKNSSIKLTCSKDFFESIKIYFSEYPESRVQPSFDEKMKEGDFKISWDTGFLLRNADETIRKIMSDLFLSPFNE